MPVDTSLVGGCDCHVHVVDSLDVFPQSPTRSYTANLAPLGSLQALANPEGVSRFVIVQPSFYATDNACLLDALDKLGENGRGVAAVDRSHATAALLQEYERRGVRGLRLNLYSKSLTFAPERVCDLLAEALEKVPSNRWHVEIIAPISLLMKVARIVADSSVPVVLDHYGLPGESSPDSCEGRVLLDLIALPHVWVKLTAPYRVAADRLATHPPANWLAAFLQAAPHRCVWGSDWPHTPLDCDQKSRDEIAPYRKISYARLVRDFTAALPGPALARRVLVENPERLYEFPRG